jgi:hypothetical protein
MDKESQNGFVGAGGTPGGVGIFLLGFAMACAGGWLLTNQVTVTSEYFASGFMIPVINYRINRSRSSSPEPDLPLRLKTKRTI